MTLFVVGSIKIDSYWRKKVFLQNLNSLKPISSLLSWSFNIVGKYSDDVRKEILKTYKNSDITSDNESSFYDVVQKQISSLDDKALLFFLLEDHLFVCPHKDLFFYLLEEFNNSKANVLRATHLFEFWERENVYHLIVDKPLYKEYLIDSDALKSLWKKYPEAYIISIPGIFKKDFVLDLLDNNKPLISSKRPHGFELYGEKATEFLAKRSFITMAPNFHVLREVFLVSQEDRSIDFCKALQIIKLRDSVEPKIRLWRRAVLYISHPRMLGGKIKRRIMGLIKKN